MSYKDVITAASRVVNSVLGVRCDYEHRDGTFTSDILISINRNREVKGDFGIIAGSYIEVSILKSDIDKVRPDDRFIDEDGQTYEITEMVKDTTAKWYASVIEIF